MSPYPVALTIAGSDSGGGAGIQADLKTFLDHGVFGMSAITAITAQNSRGVSRVDLLPPEGLLAQLQAVADDFPIDAIKIGMLGTAAHALVVARFLESLRDRPPIVLDPVMVASTGHRLLDSAAQAVVRDQLIPLATIVTPNLDEAAVLADAPGREAAITYALSTSTPFLITGGDIVGDEIVDVLVTKKDVARFTHPRRGTKPFHGTGCTLASAIAARLARRESVHIAVEGAIGYVQELIEIACAIGSIGSGNPSLPHGIKRFNDSRSR